jgi:hypothetical protein
VRLVRRTLSNIDVVARRGGELVGLVLALLPLAKDGCGSAGFHQNQASNLPTEVLSDSTLLTWWMMGPKTRGGLMVTPSKEVFSSLINFQKACSAKVLEANFVRDTSMSEQRSGRYSPRYLSPPGASRPFSSQTLALYSFQSFSVKLYVSHFSALAVNKDSRVRSLDSAVHDSCNGTEHISDKPSPWESVSYLVMTTRWTSGLFFLIDFKTFNSFIECAVLITKSAYALSPIDC